MIHFKIVAIKIRVQEIVLEILRIILSFSMAVSAVLSSIKKIISVLNMVTGKFRL